jgi:hypothetical protein
MVSEVVRVMAAKLQLFIENVIFFCSLHFLNGILSILSRFTGLTKKLRLK